MNSSNTIRKTGKVRVYRASGLIETRTVVKTIRPWRGAPGAPLPRPPVTSANGNTNKPQDDKPQADKPEDNKPEDDNSQEDNSTNDQPKVKAIDLKPWTFSAPDPFDTYMPPRTAPSTTSHIAEMLRNGRGKPAARSKPAGKRIGQKGGISKSSKPATKQTPPHAAANRAGRGAESTASGQPGAKSATTGRKRKAGEDEGISPPTKLLKQMPQSTAPPTAIMVPEKKVASPKRRLPPKMTSGRVAEESKSAPAKRPASGGPSPKRKREVIDDAGESESSASKTPRRASKVGDKREPSSKPSNKRSKIAQKTATPRGLLRYEQSCYSGAVLQVLDAALDGSNDLELLGDASSVADLGISNSDCANFDARETLDSNSAKKKPAELLKRLQDEFRIALKDERMEDISVSKHLRHLLDEVRAEVPALESVSPLRFQQVFALRAKEGVSNKNGEVSNKNGELMDGTTQEDCTDYFELVMEDVLKDDCTADKSALSKLFTLKTEARDVCSSCDHEGEIEHGEQKHWSIRLPSADRGNVSLINLLKTATEDETDRNCAKCGSELRRATTITTLPEELVVSFQRTLPDGSKNTKNIDFVDTYSIGGHDFELAAIVRHQGKYACSGHYTVSRKHNDIWYDINDASVTRSKANVLRDYYKSGQTAMVLLKRIAETHQ